MAEFVAFPKIPRYSRTVVVTEKIDGTNAQIFIDEEGNIQAGSRSRWITPENDNYGFARWVEEHKSELLALGPGQHFGEWWGQGIQRRYDLLEKRFSLFNAGRWGPEGSERDKRPACCHVVPVIWQGNLRDFKPLDIIKSLKENGSVAAPGFPNPEGIVIYHSAARMLFKMTCEKDDQPKGVTE